MTKFHFYEDGILFSRSLKNLQFISLKKQNVFAESAKEVCVEWVKEKGINLKNLKNFKKILLT